MRSHRSRALGASVLVGVVLASASALAADPPPPCDSLGAAGQLDVPKIYIESGDTQTPMLQRLGALLLKSSTPLRIVFRERPTCSLATDMFGTDPRMNTAQDTSTTGVVTPRPVRYIPDGAAIAADQKAPICTVPDDAASAKPIQLGIGATYLTSCSGLMQPTGVNVVNGPIQAYGFVTNLLSSEQAITAEEGYLAFGFPDGDGGAAPWILKDLKFQRAATASTTLTMAAAIRVLPAKTKMLGTVLSPDTSANIVAQVQAATANPSASIGTLGMDLYDANRDKVKLLAFRTFQQRFAYYPDATSTSFDKVNVRDGHYAPWAPTPYIAKGDGTNFTDPAARRVYELVLGLRSPTASTDDVDGLKAVIQSSLIPECAMKVTRSGDGADFSLYGDPNPCGCYFEANVAGGTTSCTACTDANQCGTGICRYGYCEAK